MTAENPPQAPVVIRYESADGPDVARGRDLHFEKSLGFVTITPVDKPDATRLIDRSAITDMDASADEYDPDGHGVTDTPGLAPEDAITRDGDDSAECPDCEEGRLYDDLGGGRRCPNCGYESEGEQ